MLATVLIRLIRLDQPIVENYVGRQVPTAMVARNLERGSGFLRPQLDTAPFPNYFMVEPPVYQLAVVGLRRLTGCRLEACGRALSAAAMALGAWGLFGLVRRRDGDGPRLPPRSPSRSCRSPLRYGRAFQPDALMLGAVLAGLDAGMAPSRGLAGGGCFRPGASWRSGSPPRSHRRSSWFRSRWESSSRPKARKSSLRPAHWFPCLLWYLWANHLVESGGGSRASAENRAIWLAVPGFSALGNPETLTHLWRFLVVRAFTPPGLLLAVWGLCLSPKGQGRSRPLAGLGDCGACDDGPAGGETPS